MTFLFLSPADTTPHIKCKMTYLKFKCSTSFEFADCDRCLKAHERVAPHEEKQTIFIR